MSRLPKGLSHRRVIVALKRAGFKVRRQKGSHIVMSRLPRSLCPLTAQLTQERLLQSSRPQDSTRMSSGRCCEFEERRSAELTGP